MANEVFGDDDFDFDDHNKNRGSNRKTLLLFILVPLVVIAGILAALYFSGVAEKMIDNNTYRYNNIVHLTERQYIYDPEYNKCFAYFPNIREIIEIECTPRITGQ